MNHELGFECRFLKGVGPVRAERLKRLGIITVEDLITHYPRKYYDRRSFARVADLKAGEEACVSAQILSTARRSTRTRRSIITAAVGDETGIIQVIWFNQDYLYKQLKPGSTIVMTGEISYFKGIRQIVNPEFELVGDDLNEQLLHAGRMVPVYPLTGGISQRFLRGLIARTLESAGKEVYENLPEQIVDSIKIPPRCEAIKQVHFPEGEAGYKQAVRRLRFEELFYLQLVFSLVRRRSGTLAHKKFDIAFDYIARYSGKLPFNLTHAQRRVINEIKSDLCGPRGMNRLLQGDVGSGKTVVAGAALLCAVEAGCQAAFMVPTEILAVQHARTLGGFFADLGVETDILLGSTSTREKKRIYQNIAGGKPGITIGTHALIQSGVKFKNLGLAVIDEQHRFGVRQRAALMSQKLSPHLLVMTATPIPRSLALTAYGDLDLSIIDELPPGKANTITRLVNPEKTADMLDFVRGELDKDKRAYFLYPLIEETEKQDMQAAAAAHAELSQGRFGEYGVGLLHGRMNFEEKEKAMHDFASGKTKLLISTTVIEVGVHVPEATIMVVHHPDRFGLSQLHQLRGRVGRGSDTSYCFLQLHEGVSNSARRRLHILTKVSDGFRISEEDLKMRGPGEFFGLRQHGVPGFKLANPARDQDLVEKANGFVRNLLKADPNLVDPCNALCRKYLDTFSSVDIRLARAG